LAQAPQNLIERPAADDALSSVLRAVRLTGSVQFCFMPSGRWQTDAAPSLSALSARPGGVMPFHVVVQGGCWLKIEGRTLRLEAGDVVAFPFGTGHQLGAGEDGLPVSPVRDLPPRPWRETPILRYRGPEGGDGCDGADGSGGGDVRLLCGYLAFAASGFQPLRDALPSVLHVLTAGAEGMAWLGATIARMVAEVDHPRAGGLSVLERLTEIVFIEVLRHHIASTAPGARGWLAAMADPALARCLALVHAQPGADWSVAGLATAVGLSRSSLSERFEAVLATSPMRYVRGWRLYLAGVALATSAQPIAAIAYEAGYGTEAAFNRAFARAHGEPPATWRARIRGAAEA
jgi:AraC-like DNA-binding protein